MEPRLRYQLPCGRYRWYARFERVSQQLARRRSI